MANKRFLTKDLKNGMAVTSMYNDLGLHINHYSNGVSIITQYYQSYCSCTKNTFHWYNIEVYVMCRW